MARTRLFSWLQRLAYDHAQAARLGLPLDVVRTAPTRRQVMAGAGAVSLAALALPSGARAADGGATASAPAASGPRIAIIGGGISGLTAALSLRDAGYASTVYEASNRAGGRMYSSNDGYWAERQVSEWGGEFIDSNHATLHGLVKRFKLELEDTYTAPAGAEGTNYFFGKYYRGPEIEKDFAPVWEALKKDLQAAGYPTLFNYHTPGAAALDRMTVHEWIETRVPDGHRSAMGMLLDVAYAIEYAADTTEQSAMIIVNRLGHGATGAWSLFGESDEKWRIRGGNQQLPIAMMRALPSGSFLTGHRLAQLKKQPDGTYALTFELAGKRSIEVKADHVVLALPFAVLRTLDFSQAGFDPLKTTAITELGTGKCGKLHLQFTSRFWNKPGAWPGLSNGESYSDAGFQDMYEVTSAQKGKSGILVEYTGGSVTLAMATAAPWANVDSPGVAADAKTFFTRAQPVFPGIAKHWNGKAQSSLPFKDPNLGLVYTSTRPGQFTKFGGYERVRQGNVHFAGEHCSIDFRGYMEGAASEGARAASELLAELPKRAEPKP